MGLAVRAPEADAQFLSMIKPMIGRGLFNIIGDGGYSITGIAEEGDLDIQIIATMDTLDNMEMAMLYACLLSLLKVDQSTLRMMKHRGGRLIIMQSI